MKNIHFYRRNQPEPEAVIAGTFCLMSCTMMSGSKMHLHKIIDNFNFLADCEAIAPALRTLCRRMACHWEAEQQVALPANTVSESIVNDEFDAMPISAIVNLPNENHAGTPIPQAQLKHDADANVEANPNMTPQQASQFVVQFLTRLV